MHWERITGVTERLRRIHLFESVVPGEGECCLGPGVPGAAFELVVTEMSLWQAVILEVWEVEAS